MIRFLCAFPLLALAVLPIRAEDPPAGYAETVAKRAAAAVDAAKVEDPAKAARARKLVEGHYIDLNTIHTARDAAVKAAAGNADAIKTARAKADAEVKVVNDKFLAGLAAELTPAQAEAVIDKMTYNVVQVTYKAYGEMLPKLTDEQKAKILELLKEGRAEALVAGASKEKHAAFGRYKGKINNYLAAQGYDLKAAGQALAERKKANPPKAGK